MTAAMHEGRRIAAPRAFTRSAILSFAWAVPRRRSVSALMLRTVMAPMRRAMPSSVVNSSAGACLETRTTSAQRPRLCRQLAAPNLAISARAKAVAQQAAEALTMAARPMTARQAAEVCAAG
jgi:hypothetical protein